MEQLGDGDLACLPLGQVQAVTRGGHVRRLRPAQQRLGTRHIPLAQQEVDRLRQLAHQQRQHQQGHHGDEEHRLPAPGGHQQHTQAGGEHAAHRVAAEHDRHQGAADLLRRIFVHQRHHVGHHAADAEPGDEAADGELLGRAREAIDQGEAAEQDHAGHDGLAPPDPVRQRAEEQRPQHHPHQRAAAEQAGLKRSEVPGLHQRGQHHAVDDQVVAVEDDDQRAPEQHACVEGVEAGPVEQG
ncbi:hypothetical protein D9M71_351460 [compost metagenome]